MKLKFPFYVLLSIILFSCENNAVIDVKTKKKEKSEFIIYLDSINGFTADELTPIKLNSEKIKIVSFGHVHSLMEFPDLLSRFYTEIRNEQPDIVIIAGDVVFYNHQKEWDSIQKELDLFTCPYFLIPGNHDYGFYEEEENGIQSGRDSAKQMYLNNAKSRYKYIQTPYQDLYLINSNDPLNKISDFFSKHSFQHDKSNILFSHHNLFIEKRRFDSIPNSWTGTWFKRKQLADSLNHFGTFVNGDWNLHFDDRIRTLDNKNVRTISIGNRMKSDPLFYTVMNLTKDSVIAYPKIIHIDSTHRWYQH